MNKGAVLLFISLGVGACFQVIDCEEKEKDRRLLYVEFPFEEELNTNPFHVAVKAALTKVELPSTNPMDVRNALIDARINELDGGRRQIYEYMVRLGNTMKQQCSRQLTEVYISLWAQSIENDELKPFYNYVKPIKFVQCANKVNREFIARPFEPDALSDLFRLMCATTGENQDKCDTAKLYLKLKNFRLSKMRKLHVQRMVEAAKKIDTIETKQNPNMYNLLQYFWSNRCDVFELGSLPYMVNVLSLAQTKDFDSEKFDIRLLLLNEYHRLCKEWRDDFEKSRFTSGPGPVEVLVKSVEEKIKAEQDKEAVGKAVVGESA